MNLLRFIGNIINIFHGVGLVKSDPELRPKSVRYGVSAIIMSFVAVALSAAGSLLFFAAIENIDSLSILFIFPLTFGAGFMAGAVLTAIGAVVRAIAQLTINRRAIGFIALLISIAGAVAAVLIFFMLTS